MMKRINAKNMFAGLLTLGLIATGLEFIGSVPSAFAFYIQPRVDVTSSTISAYVCNDEPEAVNCNVHILGFPAEGTSLHSFTQMPLAAGQCEYAYLHINGNSSHFVDGRASVSCF